MRRSSPSQMIRATWTRGFGGDVKHERACKLANSLDTRLQGTRVRVVFTVIICYPLACRSAPRHRCLGTYASGTGVRRERTRPTESLTVYSKEEHLTKSLGPISEYKALILNWNVSQRLGLESRKPNRSGNYGS